MWCGVWSGRCRSASSSTVALLPAWSREPTAGTTTCVANVPLACTGWLLRGTPQPNPIIASGAVWAVCGQQQVPQTYHPLCTCCYAEQSAEGMENRGWVAARSCAPAQVRVNCLPAERGESVCACLPCMHAVAASSSVCHALVQCVLAVLKEACYGCRTVCPSYQCVLPLPLMVCSWQPLALVPGATLPAPLPRPWRVCQRTLGVLLGGCVGRPAVRAAGMGCTSYPTGQLSTYCTAAAGCRVAAVPAALLPPRLGAAKGARANWLPCGPRRCCVHAVPRVMSALLRPVVVRVPGRRVLINGRAPTAPACAASIHGAVQSLAGSEAALMCPSSCGLCRSCAAGMPQCMA